METKNIISLILVIALVVGAIAYLEHAKPKHAASSANAAFVTHDPSVQTKDYAQKSLEYHLAKELVHPDGYLNTPASTTIQSFIGKKVILVDFWTYSCINCQRTLPYLTSWYGKYKDAGLVIIGVHTPEFDFEKNKDNVAMALKKYGIDYPVVLDNEYATWDAYGNQYWPEHYLIDINGLVVDRHIGEGGYDDTEKLIQQLLAERKQVLGETGEVPTGLVAPGEAIAAGSPETYFGWSRNEFLGNGKQNTAGEQTLTRPALVAPNTLFLTGTWNFAKESATTVSADAGVIYSYDAKHVYLVASSEKGAVVTVMRDGVPIGASERGEDVDAQGQVHIQEPRLYKLINEKEEGAHTIELRVQTPGLEAFTFTFG
ncbi:MAG: redoxin family protein [Patescibacteria group bacterium]